MFDVVSFGELLIDFTPLGISEKGNPMFERNPGGGPANMACAAAKLGAKTAFMGKVGDDMFGQALYKVMENQGVDVSGLLLSKEHKTTLAFVQLDETGDRSFSFYRKNSADTMIKFEELNLSLLEGNPYFFFSSVMMAEGTSREASFQLVEYAKEKGCIVVFDPNLRFNLWDDTAAMKELCLRAFGLSQIIKVSEEEITWLMDEPDIEKAALKLRETYKPMILMVTLGAEGCAIYSSFGDCKLPGFKVATVDTTAAGDSFTGGFLSRLASMNRDLIECNIGDIVSCAVFANAVGALTTTKKGAISALPTLEEVEEFLKQNL